jgi:hypothetical protein
MGELAQIISCDKGNNNGKLSEPTSAFVYGALRAFDECYESWCDGCRIKEELGMLCDKFMEKVEGTICFQ